MSHRKPLSLSTSARTKEDKLKMEIRDSLAKANNDNLQEPSWLKDEFALKEYNRLVKELEILDFLTNLDTNNLAGYCQAYSNYVKATEKLNQEELTVIKHLPNGAYTTVENPLIKIQKLYAEEMRRFAGLVGLTIDSRLKVASIRAEKINNDVEDTFGDI